MQCIMAVQLDSRMEMHSDSLQILSKTFDFTALPLEENEGNHIGEVELKDNKIWQDKQISKKNPRKCSHSLEKCKSDDDCKGTDKCGFYNEVNGVKVVVLGAPRIVVKADMGELQKAVKDGAKLAGLALRKPTTCLCRLVTIVKCTCTDHSGKDERGDVDSLRNSFSKKMATLEEEEARKLALANWKKRQDEIAQMEKEYTALTLKRQKWFQDVALESGDKQISRISQEAQQLAFRILHNNYFSPNTNIPNPSDDIVAVDKGFYSEDQIFGYLNEQDSKAEVRSGPQKIHLLNKNISNIDLLKKSLDAMNKMNKIRAKELQKIEEKREKDAKLDTELIAALRDELLKDREKVSLMISHLSNPMACLKDIKKPCKLSEDCVGGDGDTCMRMVTILKNTKPYLRWCSKTNDQMCRVAADCPPSEKCEQVNGMCSKTWSKKCTVDATCGAEKCIAKTEQFRKIEEKSNFPATLKDCATPKDCNNNLENEASNKPREPSKVCLANKCLGGNMSGFDQMWISKLGKQTEKIIETVKGGLQTLSAAQLKSCTTLLRNARLKLVADIKKLGVKPVKPAATQAAKPTATKNKKATSARFRSSRSTVTRNTEKKDSNIHNISYVEPTISEKVAQTSKDISKYVAMLLLYNHEVKKDDFQVRLTKLKQEQNESLVQFEREANEIYTRKNFLPSTGKSSEKESTKTLKDFKSNFNRYVVASLLYNEERKKSNWPIKLKKLMQEQNDRLAKYKKEANNIYSYTYI